MIFNWLGLHGFQLVRAAWFTIGWGCMVFNWLRLHGFQLVGASGGVFRREGLGGKEVKSMDVRWRRRNQGIEGEEDWTGMTEVMSGCRGKHDLMGGRSLKGGGDVTRVSIGGAIGNHWMEGEGG